MRIYSTYLKRGHWLVLRPRAPMEKKTWQSPVTTEHEQMLSMSEALKKQSHTLRLEPLLDNINGYKDEASSCLMTDISWCSKPLGLAISIMVQVQVLVISIIWVFPNSTTRRFPESSNIYKRMPSFLWLKCPPIRRESHSMRLEARPADSQSQPSRAPARTISGITMHCYGFLQSLTATLSYST